MKTQSYSSLDQLTPAQAAYLQNLSVNNSVQRVLLGKLSSANMNTTGDQPITINSSNYIIRSIVVTNASISLTASVGGLYVASSKTNPIVASTQIYTALSSSSKTLDLTLNTLGVSDRRTENTLYLSLTTPQGSPATCDIYVFGDKLD